MLDGGKFPPRPAAPGMRASPASSAPRRTRSRQSPALRALPRAVLEGHGAGLRSPSVAITSTPPASRTSSGVQWPHVKSGSSHSTTPRAAARRSPSPARPRAAPEPEASATTSVARSAHPAASPTSAMHSNTCSSVTGSRFTTRGRPEAACGGLNLRLGDGAHVAQRLGHHQVGSQRLEYRHVQRIERVRPSRGGRERARRSLPLLAS